ncbi:hypothetical protein Moror_17019 [Moniliophthora roreri MCA 2997]|uniref:F-box domain-containing protein n=2 Tax=Moniliophthora roreri TaxID=221103 RepID=V2WVF8_MONRO|nr:hypothetical protein Moror_17019 [Moniliophthora roreri MCA 2997]
MEQDTSLRLRTQLPLEVVEIIIEPLIYSPRDLQNCALVSQTWLYAARRHLFTVVRLDPANFLSFAKLCARTYPYFSPRWVKHIVIHEPMTIPAFRSLLSHHDLVKNLPLNISTEMAALPACKQLFHENLPKLTMVGITERDWRGCVTKSRILFNQFTGVKEVSFRGSHFWDIQQQIDITVSFSALEKVSFAHARGKEHGLVQPQRQTSPLNLIQLPPALHAFQAYFVGVNTPYFLPLMKALGPQIDEWTFEFTIPMVWDLQTLDSVMSECAIAEKQRWKLVIHDSYLDFSGLGIAPLLPVFIKHLTWNNRITAVVLKGAWWYLLPHVFNSLTKEPYPREKLAFIESLTLPEYSVHSSIPIKEQLEELDIIVRHPQFQRLREVHLAVSSSFPGAELLDAGYDRASGTVKVGSSPWMTTQEKLKKLKEHMPWAKEKGILKFYAVYVAV